MPISRATSETFNHGKRENISATSFTGWGSEFS